MIKTFIVNDLKCNRLISLATFIFMCISGMLIALTLLLSGSLLNSIDTLMEQARTPHLLQMHAGELNEDEIRDFALSYEQIKYWQVCHFLNIDDALIAFNGNELVNNNQDNGFCVQNKDFDLMITTDGFIAQPNTGEVYIPACYRSLYGIKLNDTMSIGDLELNVAGFIRDSQMNSMMASSKRFLVNEDDYEKIKLMGVEEYLIEFYLNNESAINKIANKYSDEGLPANGPTITLPLIRLMNALSDGMMILIILLVSVVILIISILCIRFIVTTDIEKDKQAIGMLKAIGIAPEDIRRLFFTKFFVLSFAGGVVGLLLASVISGPLSEQMKELYGASSTGSGTVLLSVTGVIIVEGIILLSVRRTLKQIEKLSAVQVLQKYGNGDTKRNTQYLLIGFITMACVFLMLIPENISSTIASPKFVTYMGIGNGQIRLDIRQTSNIINKTKDISDVIENDSRVAQYTVLQTKMLRMSLPDGGYSNLLVEHGDHNAFPVSYAKGNAPSTANDIALSSLNAEELGLQPGNKLILENTEYTVCGIYSDITNGGKTAKAYMSESDMWNDSDAQVMWSIIYVTLEHNENIEQWINDYQSNGVKVTGIADYVSDTYGQTISQIKLATWLVYAASGLILFIVIVLFIRMIVERERMDSSFKKAIGYTGMELIIEYIKKILPFVVMGIIAGIIFGVVLGEQLIGILLGTLGVSDFKIVMDYVAVFVVIPVVNLVIALMAVRTGLSEIKNIRAYEAL